MSLALFERLPERMATHWGLSGQPDGWSGRTFGAFGLPGLMLFIWALCYWLPAIDPRRENYAKFRGSYDVVVAGIVAVLLIVHAAILGVAMGLAVPIPIVVSLAVGSLLMLIGNLLPRARPNWFFGIRTPWTLSNDRVWDRTHRVGGRVMVVAGLIVAIAGFSPPPWPALLMAVAAGGAALVSIVYSYAVWRQQRST
jgi:uncharacterized membrane protein